MVSFTPVEEGQRRARRPRFVPEEREAADAGSPVHAAGRSALERFFDNVIQVPELAGQALLNIESPLSMLQSQTTRDIQAARTGEPVERRTLFEDLTGREPPERLIPITGEDVMAAGDVAAQVPGALFSGEPLRLGERFQQATEAGDALAAEHPFASGVGTVAGDAATLATGRAPFARRLVGAERSLLRPPSLPPMEPGVRRLLRQAANSQPARRLARAAGRSAETGLEAAALGALQDGDPAEAFGFGAGAQLAGSGALEANRHLFSGGPLRAGAKIGFAALATGSLIQILKEATPGGRDFILESAESGFGKIAYGLGAGALAGLAGAGRLRSLSQADDLPVLLDGISSLQRGAVISALQQWVSADERGEGETIAAVLERLAVDPNHFGEDIRNAFERGRLDQEIESRLEDPEFRSRLRAPLPSPQERAQRRLRDEVSADTRGVQLPSARSVAERLGAGENVESGAAFVHGQLRDPRRAGEVLRRLNKRDRLDGLEVTLTRLLRQSEVREGDRRVFDGDRLQRAWDRLPPATREAFPQPTRRAIEQFIGEAQGGGLYSLPPLLAKSLMTVNGRLSRRLRGDNIDD